MCSSLQQSSQYRRALDLIGVETCDVDGGGVMVRRRWPVIGAVGVLSRAAAIDVPALRVARKSGLRIINSENPLDTAPRRAGFRRILTSAHIAEIDLQGDPRARMHQKWRNRLVKAEQSSVKLRRVFWTGGHHWLLEKEEAQRKARGYRTLPVSLLSAYAHVSPGDAVIFEAWHGVDPIAAMLFLRHGRTATYQCGWTSERGRADNAHTLILARAMADLSQQGHRWLDLGVIDTMRTPGLARFKLGAGARVRELGGTWAAFPGL